MSTADFAAAQARVNARRAAREVNDQARVHRQRSGAQSSPLSRLPFPLSRASVPLHFICILLQRREGTRPAFRVGQVDAELLDEELLELIKGQCADALKYFGPHLADDWSQEILLVLRAILFKLSIWDHDASYGAVLQNLRYSDARSTSLVPSRPSRWQKSLYGAFTVLGRYAWQKWEAWLLHHGAPHSYPYGRVWLVGHLTSWLSITHSIASFISFLVFLVNGRYRTLTDRLLQLRLTAPSGHGSRDISFEYLNRQLVWHAFTEFLLFLLPLVGINRWRRWLGRAWRKAKLALRSEGDALTSDGRSEEDGPLAHLFESTCAICYQNQNLVNTSATEILGINASAIGVGVTGSATTDIVNPYQGVPCGCIYCFICIATKLEAEDGGGWPCLRCGKVITICTAWNGDVLNTTNATVSAKGKTVGFAQDSHEGVTMGSLAEIEPRPDKESQQSLREDDLWPMVGKFTLGDPYGSTRESEKG